jgi:hypothetical protein
VALRRPTYESTLFSVRNDKEKKSECILNIILGPADTTIAMRGMN